MKNKTIISVILIVVAISLIIGGAILGYDKNTKVDKNKNKPKEPVIDENYHDLGSASLKEDQVFNNIKYTQNHLSTTDDESYASFTSVIYNETGADISHKHLEIDFYDASGKLLGTMPSSIESLKQGESTVIFGISEGNFTTANSFNVREVNE